MKKLNVVISDIYPNHNLIYFETKFYWEENIFLVNRNFNTTESALKIQRYFLNLTDDLDLKYFKIEISE